MSQQNLEDAEARLREYLQVNIKARDVECLGIDCAWAAKLWKERSMTVKTMCRLQYRANNPTSLVVSGGQNHLDKTCERLEEMLQELVRVSCVLLCEYYTGKLFKLFSSNT